ncbi:MAG: alpha/beta hydrolase [Burkholderiales bacterium]|nr:alpha/beta hydrolase [Burkholderiales bacterium]
MNTHSHRLTIDGTAGLLEVLVDESSTMAHITPIGTAVIAHPHPLFGGTMENKVVQTLARAFVLCGWRAVRFNFRGVGKSQGAYDEGRGELADLLSVVAHFASDGRLAMAGFSFGSFVAAHAVQAIAATKPPEKIVLVGTAASRFQVAPIAPELHERTLVIHGELDETVPLADVMAWARPQNLPVMVVPGGEHFFHGQLPLLRGLVVRHLSAPLA